jgi:hypothetical protein
LPDVFVVQIVGSADALATDLPDSHSACRFRALHVASSKGHTATVKMLIEAGANVHCKSDNGSGQYTALHAASAEGHTATVKELLAAGADVHGKINPTDNAFGMKNSIFTPGFRERFVPATVRYGLVASHASCYASCPRVCGQACVEAGSAI